MICLLALVGLFLYRFGTDGGVMQILSQFRFFTTWGLWLTFLTLIVGSFITNDDINPVEDYNYQDQNFLKQKYSPLRAWKWFIFLYQLAFVYEIVITAFFWCVLFKGGERRNLVHFITAIGAHSVPLAVLLLEYSYNTVPFCPRHAIFIFGIAVVYLGINYLVTVKTGTPVYPPMDWKSTMGIICPIGLLVGAILIFLMLYFVTKKKLRAIELDEIVKIIEGGYEIEVNPDENDIFGIK